MTRETSTPERSVSATQRIRGLVEAAEHPVVKLDGTGRIQRVNPAIEASLLWPHAMLENASVHLLIPSSHTHVLDVFLERVLGDGVPTREMMPTVDGHGEVEHRFWSGVPSLLEGDGGSAWIIIAPVDEVPDGLALDLDPTEPTGPVHPRPQGATPARSEHQTPTRHACPSGRPPWGRGSPSPARQPAWAWLTTQDQAPGAPPPR